MLARGGALNQHVGCEQDIPGRSRRLFPGLDGFRGGFPRQKHAQLASKLCGGEVQASPGLRYMVSGQRLEIRLNLPRVLRSVTDARWSDISLAHRLAPLIGFGLTREGNTDSAIEVTHQSL